MALGLTLTVIMLVGNTYFWWHDIFIRSRRDR
jgi:hypothetical protein